MPRRLEVLAAVFVGLLGFAAVAAARQVDVPQRLSSAIPKAHDSGLVVLLPSRINLDYKASGKIYADGEGDADDADYELSLSATKDCDGNACFLAEFQGEKDAKLGYETTNVKLALGLKGYYKAQSCGASCSPPSIQWIQKGVRYEIQAKALGGRKAFVSMANSAINAGNRK